MRELFNLVLAAKVASQPQGSASHLRAMQLQQLPKKKRSHMKKRVRRRSKTTTAGSNGTRPRLSKWLRLRTLNPASEPSTDLGLFNRVAATFKSAYSIFTT